MKYVFAVLALALAGAGVWTGWPAYRAAHAAATPCDYRMAARAPGTWVSLQNCAADLFHQSTLEDVGTGLALQLVALRPAGEAAELPATVGLALTPAQVTGLYRIRPRTDVRETADLLSTLGMVAGRLKTLPLGHMEYSGLPTGLDADAVVVELRESPPTGLATVLLLAAASAAALSVVLWVGASARRRAQDLPSNDSPAVRWGLVFTLVLVGIVALARGLQWYFDPLRLAESSYSARPNPAPAPGTVRSEVPTHDEVAGVLSTDAEVQRTAIRRLVNRPVTPELLDAIDEALARQPADRLLVRDLVCLRCGDTGPGSLDKLIVRFPTDPLDMRDSRTPGVGCVAAALAARIREDPERITAVFMRTWSLDNGDVRTAALAGFGTLAPMPIPADLAVQAVQRDPRPRDRALAVVVAMGAIRSDPRLVLRSIVRPVLVEPLPEPVIDALANEPHANGARIVARLIADGRLGVHRTVAFRREATHHDLSAALLEIVANPAEPLPAANACLDWLVELKEVRVIPELRRVRASLPATPFRETLDKAIADLDALPAGVRRALMHDLPPRGDEW